MLKEKEFGKVTVELVLSWLWSHIRGALFFGLISQLITNQNWQNLRENTGSLDERLFFVVGTFLLHETLFFGVNGMTYLFHHLKLFTRFRLKETKSQPFPSSQLIKDNLKKIFFNHFILQWLTLYLIWPLFAYFGSSTEAPLPSFSTTFIQLFYSSIWIDFSFYWTHRLLHHKYFYARFHKQHHEYKYTVGFSSEYASAFESAFSAEIPTVLLAIYFGFHIWTFWIWLTWRLFDTYIGHSGYSLLPRKYDDDVGYHEFHHTVNMGNYAGMEFWDTLMGTNKCWVDDINRKVRIRNAKLKGN